MTVNINMRFVLAAMLTALSGIAVTAGARPNVNGNKQRTAYDNALRTTAAACKEAGAAIDLDINNVRARLMTGGDMWWNIGLSDASYEVPKGTKKNSLFAGSVWIGGYDPQGQLKVAAQTYRQDGNDYWPGPLTDPANDITATICSDWDRFWKVNKADVLAFRDLVAKGGYASAESDPRFQSIIEWPATGNGKAYGANGNLLGLDLATRSYAPFINGTGAGNDPDKYEPEKGDYPDIFGDQYIWWVFNDKGNVKLQTKTDAIGLEVQASAFAFGTKDALNDATFYRYRLINRSNLTLDSAYIATWTDADLGYAFDDFIGCDTVRGLGILYNGTSVDGSGQINSYGTQIPMVGIDFFEGPRKYYVDPITGKDTFRKLSMDGFYYYNNDGSSIGNPRNGQEIYGYMTGTIRNGQHFSFDWNGQAQSTSKGYGTGPNVKYVFYGDPGNQTEWSECTCGNKPDDRRFIHSAGPFKLEAGTVTNGRNQNDVTIGVVWVADAGGCPNTSFKKIRAVDDLAQDLFNSGFKTIEGPEAPRMVIRELDRKLVFYLTNDPISNNYQEKFGISDSAKYHASSTKSKKHADSLYKFEGYRVFQLKNSEVKASQIFNDRGEVNTDVAAEVFQCDVRNDVGIIRNWTKVDLGKGNDTTWTSSLKVSGKDSGIVHSFSLAFDAFAKGTDKRFVNYRPYYFVAIAYAYNDFGATGNSIIGISPSFNGSTKASADSTQDMPYLESTHGQGGIAIPVDTAMPNPANGEMGTYINSDYGDGVVIKRIEGYGNGRNFLQMSKESEDEALQGPNYQSYNPTYVGGQGPVNVKVVDPVRVQPGNWELALKGKVYSDTSKGIIPDSGRWELTYSGNGVNDVIYSERSIKDLNEQLLEKYGLSVSIKEGIRPGDDQINFNGYIGSDIIYMDPSKAWLAGVSDGENRDLTNWIRSGNKSDTFKACDFNDYKLDTVGQFYETLFGTNTLMKASWAPYALAAGESAASCGFGVAYKSTSTISGFSSIRSVDLVMTPDKTKWTKCVVLEMQDEVTLAEGGGKKFMPRQHASWNGDLDAYGNPVYVTTGEKGFSWFPGYAVDQETGERVNIAFGEDSYLKGHNGGDMIWNPTSTVLNESGNVVFGGKHYVYILNTKYDEGKSFYTMLTTSTTVGLLKGIPSSISWVGVPRLNPGYRLNNLQDGLIPTETRLRFRVERPYTSYLPNPAVAARNNAQPLYSFSTDNLAKKALSDNANPYNSDKQALLDKIMAVPNPYYAYAGYEFNRLDTRIRITNLPRKATINVYALDGSLVRQLTKDNPNASYIDWDVRNTKGLPIASGMYLIHVNAEGIGETIIRWFGAMRPIDVTNY